MAEDLRHRIAEALADAAGGQRFSDPARFGAAWLAAADAVMAVRDEELERLRSRVGWHGECVPITKWAEELRDKLNAAGQREQALAECNGWRERAETAGREAERMRVLFLQRCSAIERVRHVCREAKARKNAPGMWLVAEQVLAALDSQDTDRG